MADSCNAFSEVSFATLAAYLPTATHCAAEKDIISGDDHTAIDQQVEAVLMSLMANGLLEQHRIDAVDMRVVALAHDVRNELRVRVLEAAGETEREVLLKLHRANFVVGALEVRGWWAWRQALG